MFKLKWFAGGTDRAKQAVEIIDALLAGLNSDSQTDTLKNVLLKYQLELQEKKSSVPFILSRMNIEISDAIVESGLTLSAAQSSELQQLTDIANIRYGY